MKSSPLTISEVVLFLRVNMQLKMCKSNDIAMTPHSATDLILIFIYEHMYVCMCGIAFVCLLTFN